MAFLHDASVLGENKIWTKVWSFVNRDMLFLQHVAQVPSLGRVAAFHSTNQNQTLLLHHAPLLAPERAETPVHKHIHLSSPLERDLPKSHV